MNECTRDGGVALSANIDDNILQLTIQRVVERRGEERRTREKVNRRRRTKESHFIRCKHIIMSFCSLILVSLSISVDGARACGCLASDDSGSHALRSTPALSSIRACRKNDSVDDDLMIARDHEDGAFPTLTISSPAEDDKNDASIHARYFNPTHFSPPRPSLM